MTYKNGKFYNEEGSIVPLEFGNTEQIKIIEKVKELRDGVLCIGPVTCLCGEENTTAFQDDLTFGCASCRQRYKFFYYDDEIPCVKMIT